LILIGCDFSSSPSKRKPIVVALGHAKAGRVQLQSLQRFDTLASFADWLKQPQTWVGGFDLPFGLPRELVETLNWPRDWLPCMQHYAALSRAEIRDTFKAFCDARPVGGKFAHRATDTPAGSSPSMKWVNPPVAFMLHAGVPLLIDAGVTLPGVYMPAALSDAASPSSAAIPSTLSTRIALEAYPGLLARELIGNTSYKSDDKAKQTPERLIARKQLLQALEIGQTRLGLRLKLTHAQHDILVDDASGDSLDAVLCMVQAAWAHMQHEAGHGQYGLPACDPLEGWIVTA
jgi:hypothetical protein